MANLSLLGQEGPNGCLTAPNLINMIYLTLIRRMPVCPLSYSLLLMATRHTARGMLPLRNKEGTNGGGAKTGVGER